MPHRDLNNLTLVEHLWFLTVAMIVGIVNFIKRQLNKEPLLRKIILLIQDILVVGSLSIFTGYIVLGWTDSFAWSLGIGGLMGHYGNRAVYLIELIIGEKLKSKELIERAKEELDADK